MLKWYRDRLHHLPKRMVQDMPSSGAFKLASVKQCSAICEHCCLRALPHCSAAADAAIKLQETRLYNARRAARWALRSWCCRKSSDHNRNWLPSK